MKKLLLLTVLAFGFQANASEDQPYFHFECEVQNENFKDYQQSSDTKLLKIYNVNSGNEFWSNISDANDADCNEKGCSMSNGCDNGFEFTPDQKVFEQFKNKELKTDYAKINAKFEMYLPDSVDGKSETETVSCVLWATKNPVEQPLYMGEKIKRRPKIKSPDGKPGVIGE